MPDRALARRLHDLARDLAPARPLHIVDVGANPLEDPPYAPLAAAGLADLVGFEPQADAFAALTSNAPEHARFVNAAIGPAGPAHLNLYGDQSGLASLFQLRGQTMSYLRRFQSLPDQHSSIDVTLNTLDALDDVPAMDLLKLDVQGAELSILQGARTKLAQAEAVIVELRYFPLYEGEPTFAQTHSELSAQGFGLHKMLDHNHIAIGSRHIKALNRRAVRSQLIDGDVVYLRSPDAVDTKTDAALINLALLSAGAWASHDLVLRCLEILEDRGRVTARTAQSYIAALPSDLRRAVPA